MKAAPGTAPPRQEPEIMLAVTEFRIAWVLDHPHMSEWLKQAVSSSAGLDPIALQNDVEMLRHLIILRAQAQAQVEIAKTSSILD